MKITHPFATGLVGLLATTAMRGLIGSLDVKLASYDPSVDPISPDCPGPMIYIFWHEYILAPVYLRGHLDVAVLLSRHRDADFLAAVARTFGMESVRGSSYRGAATAVRELLRKGRSMHFSLTPDGPRGPRRQMAVGPIYLASKLQMPLVCLGVGLDRPWRLGTWDRFAIPRPGSRMRAIFSPAITIPPELDRDGLEDCRSKAERLLDRLTAEAEAWAEAGTSKLEETPVRRQAPPRGNWRSRVTTVPVEPVDSRRIILPPAA
jgi:hypothetical protein